ncbi:hypothetical protein [uncultured Nonlabens sp.]|uniref:hypothetical protein n=1 Tax=uncultured Nonlabens sp. TaxID=859306 RepID=UPI002613DF79|nr:hypothetical protein [uncultured Nonlabens sp.]
MIMINALILSQPVVELFVKMDSSITHIDTDVDSDIDAEESFKKDAQSLKVFNDFHFIGFNDEVLNQIVLNNLLELVMESYSQEIHRPPPKGMIA